MIIIRDIFDFDIGHLAKSPCRECQHRQNLPDCSEQCEVLDNIQTMLARAISCTGRHPFLES